MATASTKEPAVAASGDDPAEAVRKKKFEKVKKEIRSILITAAQTGRTPEEMERDYRDLNGAPIPYRELGYDDLYVFLDAIQDAVDVYQLDTGEIVLFAKSSKQTAHLEHLIAKAKPSRLGRFGGIVQQPPEARRGTPERRKLIEKRLIEVASQFPDYASYNELCNAYQSRFYETLDPKSDFNCNAKQLFNLKLAHVFDMKNGSSGSGGFQVRLKDRGAALATINAASKSKAGSSSVNILGTGGFGNAQATPVVSQPPSAIPKRSTQRLDEENRENFAPPPATEPVPLTIRPSHFAHSGPTSAFAPPSTSAQSFMVQQPSIPMPPMPVRLPFEPSPFGLQFMPFQMHPAPVPYCQSGPFPVVLTQLNLGPSPHLFGQAAAHRQFLYGIPAAALAGHPMMAPHPAPPPPYFSTVRMPMPMPGHPQAGMPYMVPQPELAIPTMDSNDRQSPRQPISTDSGIGLNSTTSSTLYTDAPPFVPKPSTSGATPSTSQAATAFAPSETPSATSASVSTRPSDIAPLPPPDHTSFDEEKQSSKNDSQQQQVGDLNGPEPETAAGRVPPTSFQSPIDTQAMEAEAAGSTPDMENYINTLKLECRTILKRFKKGLSYLQFGKAYREIVGKELDLEPLNMLSVGELVDEWPDVFHTQTNKNRDVLLFDKETYLERDASESAANSSKDPIGKWAEQTVNQTKEDALIAELWRIAMKLPNRDLYVADVPTAYKKFTGKPFPVPEARLDEFSLQMFEYTDRFEYRYDGVGKVCFTAIPDYDDIALDSSIDGASAAVTPGMYVQYGEAYKTQPLPVSPEQLQSMDPSDPIRYFQVTIAQVYTPGQFYIQLQSNVNALQDLLNDLNDYFADSQASNNARIGSTGLRVGMPCVCLYEDGIWHRAVVKETSGDSYFSVLLVDYGTEFSATLDELRFLPRKFSRFPAQAIEVRLAGLSPVGEAWITEAGEKLCELCGSYVLWAELYKIASDGVPLVFLTLTTENGEEMHIEEELINAGLAIVDCGIHELKLDLEGEIDSPVRGNTPVEEYSQESAGTESVEDALGMDLEKYVVAQLELALQEGDASLEDIVIMARTFLQRSRQSVLTWMPRLIEPSLAAAGVEKIQWLEEKIKWLEQLAM